MTDQEILELKESGMSRLGIAAKTGKTERQVKAALERARRDPAVSGAMAAIGTNMVPSVIWDKTDPKRSVMLKPAQSDKEESFICAIQEAVSSITPLSPELYAPRVNSGAKGEYLLVVDNADVHFGKLCVTSETGNEYNIEAARHRMIEGTRAILRNATGFGVGRILYVMGNDQLHTDDGRTTTSGTQQDTDGSFFTAYRAALQAQIDAIVDCSHYADTDLIHCMSNHDWRTGWALSQTIAAATSGFEGVRSTDYNMSERHRKYYGFERNGILLTHGDGTKEERLLGHFLNEVRPHMNNWKHLYAILHHVHHKVSKRRGTDVFQSEKDHNGITAVVTGSTRIEGHHVGVEYVRSPSPADGWHDRNGYTNRQAVEAFLYHPHDGQKIRFTEWF